MKSSKLVPAFTVLTLCSSPTFATDAPQGCYKPVRGYAASICTAPLCATQSGFYRVVLNNPDAPPLKKRFVVRGSFNGTTTGATSGMDCEIPLGLTLNHVLEERNHGGTLTTERDVACGKSVPLVDPNDLDALPPLPVKIVETLNFVAGTGNYAGLRPGSTLVLEGTLGASGFNTFKVPPKQNRTVCFD